MAKYFNNQKKTGKVAGSVFAIRHGEVIERAYNPVVANPKSASQNEARAKLKMLSQLSAAMASVVAFRRVGNVSPRNQFTRANYGILTWDGNKASVDVAALSITGGHLYLNVGTPSQGAEALTFTITTDSTIEKVVAAQFYIVGDRLRYANSVVVDVVGGGANVTLPSSQFQNRVVYVYGVRINSALIRMKFEDMQVASATAVASLVATMLSSEGDVTLTETKAFKVAPQS